MAYDEHLEERVRRFFDDREIAYEAKRMMGGLCFMVKGKMCLGVEKNRLMARIGPAAYDQAVARKGCRPMDFTGRPMRGFVFVETKALMTEEHLAFWLNLALAYNPEAPKSPKKKSDERIKGGTDRTPRAAKRRAHPEHTKVPSKLRP